PLGLGFERFYGFLGGDTNQWTPELVADNGFVEPPRSPQDGYHLTEDLADRAIRFVHDQQQATPGKPFFLYLATGAMHAPHHVAPRSEERRVGKECRSRWLPYYKKKKKKKLKNTNVKEILRTSK